MRCYMERELEHIIVHCTATPPSMDIGVDEIRQWHLARGWSDIGYHWVIRRSGLVEPGRPIGKPGAHTRGWNATSIGICLVGGVKGREVPELDDDGLHVPDANYTRAQYDALGDLLERYDLPVRGHRDMPGVTKACPCFDVQEWWGDNR